MSFSLSPVPSSGAAVSLRHGRACARNTLRAGFTLVELLVVIAIIGVLAGLITAAAWRARIHAKDFIITSDLKQLEMACQAYKEKFGEYPPGGVGSAAVNRHLRKAFPRVQIDVSGASNIVSPFLALPFWLGGMWDDTNKRFIGFSADPSNPFDPTTPSRIGPFFEFDATRLREAGTVTINYTRPDGSPGTAQTKVFYYWPQGATGDMSAGAIAYFRADNGNYATAQAWVSSNNGAAGNMRCAYPAVDTRLSNTWINPKSFQIFSSGQDVTYGNLTGPLQFPAGTNYAPETMDDITNFSGGRLENAIE